MPDEQYLKKLYNQAGFIREIGLTLESAGSGWAETKLIIQPRHLQQDSVVHAGVQATMADHTAGTAGATLLAEGQLVLTVEFKINLLRPATGDYLHCRAEVLKSGKRLIIAESAVYRALDGESKLVAKAVVTLAVLDQSDISVTGATKKR